jgi:hypothetical protein
MFCLRRYILPTPPSYKDIILTKEKLAPPPLHPDKRLPTLHSLLRGFDLHPPPTMHLLLCPTPNPLHIIMPMVRSLLLRLERRLVCATIFAFFLHTCEWVGDQQRRRECDYVDRIRVCRFRE